MKNYILLLIWTVFIQNVYAQGRNANWVFGDSAGMHFDGLNTPAVYKTNCKSKGESSTISDTAGNLLFYEFGISNLPDPCDAVYDNDFELMTNGDSIFGDTWYNTDIIVPLPDNDSLYYLFSTVISNSNRGLYSAIISKPNFLSPGVVLTKNIKHTSRQLSDCIQAVKHGNGRDWWIIVRTGAVVPSDSFFVWLLEPTGLSGPIGSKAGLSSFDGFHHIAFNKDGTKFTQVSASGIIEEFNFDRCTGNITSNRIMHYPVTMNYPRFWGVAYSPNGRFVYMSQYKITEDTGYIYQLDMSLPSPWPNRDTIWYCHPYQSIFLRLGPDKKIYVSHPDNQYAFPWYPYPDSLFTNEITYLGVINSPDSPATSCNFTPYSFYLGPNTRCYLGTSNLPDYNMGPLTGSICDTLGLSIASNVLVQAHLNAYYHQPWHAIIINADKLKGNRASIRIVNSEGKEVYLSINEKVTQGYLQKNVTLPNIASGIYIVTVTSGGQQLSQKVVVGE